MSRDNFSFFEFAVLVLFFLLVFLPILGAGYCGDDIVSSVIFGDMKLFDDTLFERIREVAEYWLKYSGRLAIMIPALYAGFFYVFDTQISYQMARCVLMFCSLSVFSWLIFLVTKRNENGLLLMLIIPAFWFVQVFHDSLISYNAVFSLNTIFIGLVACFFIKAQEGKKIFSYLGVICFLLAIMVYDLGIVAIVILVALVYAQSNKKKFLEKLREIFCMASLQKLFPYFFILLLWILLTLFLRMQNDVIRYEGLRFGEIENIIRTFFVQVFATFPLVPYQSLTKEYSIGAEYAECATLLFFCALYLIYRYLPKLNLGKENYFLVTTVGSVMLFIPAFIISLSKKYQDAAVSNPNNVYLQGYLQYFGMAILLLVLLDWLLIKTNKNKGLVVFIAIALSALISFVNYCNYKTVILRNAGEGYNQRVFLEKSLADDLLSFVPRRSVDQNLRPNVIYLESFIDGQSDFLMSRYPTIISSAMQVHTPSFLLQYSDLAANLILLGHENNEGFFGDAVIKNVNPGQDIFLIDVRYLDYIIAARVLEVKYRIINSKVVLSKYKISNPRIYFSKLSANRNEVIEALSNRFLDLKIKKFLGALMLSKNIKGETAIDLPRGEYYLLADHL